MSEREEIQVMAVKIKTRTKLKVCDETILVFGKIVGKLLQILPIFGRQSRFKFSQAKKNSPLDPK